METCPHCDYQSSVSRPNCPSCGLIKNIQKYDEMKTLLSGGFVYKNGEDTKELLGCNEWKRLQQKIG